MIVVCLFLEEEIKWKVLRENFHREDYIEGESENYYFDETFSSGFKLGFYNWLIKDEQLLGINFSFHPPN